MKNALTLPRGIKIFVLILLGLLLTGLFVWFLTSNLFPISIDFRGNLWEPAYLLTHHLNPYNIQGIFNNLNPLWFPMIIGIFFPLGYLPLQWASNLWLILSAMALFLIVVLSARPFHKSVFLILLTIFILASFPSSVGHFKFGQVSMMVCLFLFLVAKYRNQLSPILLGLLLSLSFTKPQLISLFLPTFLVIYYREEGKKKLLKLIMNTLLWSILLCVPLFIADPNWIPNFISNLQTNPLWNYPSLYSFLISIFGFRGIVFVLAGLFLAIGVGLAVFLSFKLDKFDSLLWSLALTPLFSPVIWSNDFVFMYPLLLLLVFEMKSVSSSLIAIFGFGLCLVLFIFMKNMGYHDDHYAIWVPIFFNCVLAASYILRSKAKRRLQNTQLV